MKYFLATQLMLLPTLCYKSKLILHVDTKYIDAYIITTLCTYVNNNVASERDTPVRSPFSDLLQSVNL